MVIEKICPTCGKTTHRFTARYCPNCKTKYELPKDLKCVIVSKEY